MVIESPDQFHLNENKKRLFKFCQCLPINFIEQYRKTDTYENLVIPIIFQKLRMLYKIETIDEFVIDQFLRRFVEVGISADDISHKQLSSYTSSNNLSLTNIHPSIFSVDNHLHTRQTLLDLYFFHLRRQMNNETISSKLINKGMLLKPPKIENNRLKPIVENIFKQLKKESYY